MLAEGLYRTCKARVAEIQTTYDDLLRQLDDYLAFVEGEVQAEQVKPEPDRNKLMALQSQLKGPARMREDLESVILDDLIRFADRVIRIKHWEDGVFL
ncbi:MAG: hypothetical protein JWN15_1376 [Firmicutes bacterium]|nr:hypothetical protein [Bacillota bacterium]